MRITARLEPKIANQLEFLMIKLGLSTSEVLRKGLEVLYEQHMPKEVPRLRYFGKHIGKYNLGDAQLGTHYKRELAKILDEKYPRNAPAQSDATLVTTGPKTNKAASSPKRANAGTARAVRKSPILA
jgi:hypothetical protein